MELVCPCPIFVSEPGPRKRDYLGYCLFLCPGMVGYVKPGRPREVLHGAIAKMDEAILHTGEESADTLLASRRLGRTSSDRSVYTERVFQAFGAVIYAMDGQMTMATPGSRTPRLWRMLPTPSVQTSTWITIPAELYSRLCFLSTMGSPAIQFPGWVPHPA